MKTQQSKKLDIMDSVPMVIATELLRNSLKGIKESLCSFQKMICDRFIKKVKNRKLILEIVLLGNICIEELKFKTNSFNMEC